jgi:hypothetical protein
MCQGRKCIFANYNLIPDVLFRLKRRFFAFLIKNCFVMINSDNLRAINEELFTNPSIGILPRYCIV